MKILWITNVIFPNVAKHLGYSKTVIGGWTYSAAEELKKNPEVELAVASLYSGSELKNLTLGGIQYYLIPYLGNIMKYNTALEENCKAIEYSFKPDIVHIYGTEYPITLAYLKACGSNNVVVSLQGVPSVYSRYFLSGIALIDIIRHPVLLLEKASFDRNNRIEKEALRMIKYYEGRSNWDHTVAWTYNPNSKYYHCNRTLRSIFYQNQWDIANIERHSIFLSQAQYSIKGLHQVIKALPLILRQYPDTKVYVAGNAPFDNKGLKNRIKTLGYASYLKSLIKKYGVKKQIKFLGSLSADEMMSGYLLANAFVCPSTIENVPNSVAEAQILGTPCIVSYVGGNSTLINERVDGLLYRFEENEMLAKYICEIFSNDEYALYLSKNGRQVAMERHRKENNIKTLIDIYKDIKADNIVKI